MKTTEKILRYFFAGLGILGQFVFTLGIMSSYPLIKWPAFVTGLSIGGVAVLVINAHLDKKSIGPYIGAISGLALMVLVLVAAPQLIHKSVLLLGFAIGAIIVPFSKLIEGFVKNGENGAITNAGCV